MRIFTLIIAVVSVLLLSSCGGSDGGGASSVAGYTPVTISLGGTSVAGGAVAPAGTNPSTLGIVSMSVEARDAANVLVAGPVTGTAANNFTVTLSVPNGNGISFTVRAFDGVNTKIYQGLSGQHNLTGTAITVPITMQIWLGGVAAAGAPLAGSSLIVSDASLPPQSITLTTDATGQYQGAIPSNYLYPLLLKVVRPGLPSIYSMMTRTGRVNTTPLTTIATAQSLGASNTTAIDTQFSQSAAATGNAALDRGVQAAASNLMQQLGLSAFTKLGKRSLLTDPNFVADGTGLDAVMDALDIKERDEDGDGTPDLVLANRSPQATSVLSVKSTAPSVMTREPYSFAIPGAAVAGDDIYGTPVAANSAVVISSAGGAASIPLGAAVGAGLTAQDLNKLVGALIASAEESGINVGDVNNGASLGAFVGQTIQSIATSSGAAGGAVSAATIQQAAAATKLVMVQAGNTGGVLAAGFNPYTAAQQTGVAAARFDTIPPVIAQPVDLYIEAVGVTTPYTLVAPSATDNYGVASVTVDNLGPFPLGTTVVTWTATDAYGNSSSATQQVVVQDT
ncbi:MAG: hypothetical protein Q9M13_03075, partial [Mariprofundales bacterium]|nr:hypothetical protein [Mariprofundales bacterium]